MMNAHTHTHTHVHKQTHAALLLHGQVYEFYQEEQEEGDWHTSSWREKLAEVLPLVIAAGTYASKIIVQIRWACNRCGQCSGGREEMREDVGGYVA